MAWWATTLLVGSGGFIGAASRYWLSTWSIQRFGAGFPWHTFAINVVGSLLIGIVLAHVADRSPVQLFLATGILGGFTTFSAFSVDAVSLIQRGQVASGMGYALGSAVLSIGAAWAGLALAAR